MFASRSTLSALALALMSAVAVPQAQVSSPEVAFTTAGLDRPVVVRPRAKPVEKGSALPFVRTELFFGTAKPDGVVTPQEFQRFLDSFVTPRFPDGLTVIKADGQFRGADGTTVKEDAFQLVLLYPFENRAQGSRRIEEIRAKYMELHQQESVLRVDESFVSWVRF